MIIHKLAVRDGIRHGWQVLRTNIGEIIVLGIIFLLIGFVVGIVTLIVALPLALIFVVPIILSAVQGNAVITGATVILAFFGVLAFILVSAAISSILRTFQSTTFTLAYHQWAGKKATVV
jgi:hypothetical protein